jgi:GNAT superfamily N-acetyltransferase
MIRCLSDTDLYAAITLFQSVFHFSETPFFTTAWMERYQSRSVGLWEENSLIGMAIVCGQKLEYLCIDPKHQNKGWGSILLKHVIDQCPSLYLIPADDPVLCKWYEKHGFHLSHELEMSDCTMRYYVRHPYATRSVTRRSDKIDHPLRQNRK